MGDQCTLRLVRVRAFNVSNDPFGQITRLISTLQELRQVERSEQLGIRFPYLGSLTLQSIMKTHMLTSVQLSLSVMKKATFVISRLSSLVLQAPHTSWDFMR